MDGAAIFEGSGKLTDLFGYWPSFHDAEVHELILDRVDVNPDGSSSVFPVLTVKVHVFEMTNEVDSAGYFIRTKHTLVKLRFHDVEDCQLSGFNHQNAILCPTVAEADDGSRRAPLWAVRMEAAYGLDDSFKCSKCDVVAVMPCDKDGRLLA